MIFTIKDLIILREQLLYLATLKDYKHRIKITMLIRQIENELSQHRQIENELSQYKAQIRGMKNET